MLRPIKLVIENYPEDQVEYLEAATNPQNGDSGTRKIPFSKEQFISLENLILFFAIFDIN